MKFYRSMVLELTPEDYEIIILYRRDLSVFEITLHTCSVHRIELEPLGNAWELYK
jgi:hypothetical protein